MTYNLRKLSKCIIIYHIGRVFSLLKEPSCCFRKISLINGFLDLKNCIFIEENLHLNGLFFDYFAKDLNLRLTYFVCL